MRKVTFGSLSRVHTFLHINESNWNWNDSYRAQKHCSSAWISITSAFLWWKTFAFAACNNKTSFTDIIYDWLGMASKLISSLMEGEQSVEVSRLYSTVWILFKNFTSQYLRNFTEPGERVTVPTPIRGPWKFCSWHWIWPGTATSYSWRMWETLLTYGNLFAWSWSNR